MSFYIPEAFRVADQSEIEAIIEQNGFGHLITSSDGPDQLPSITPLPMLIEEGILYGHLARPNPQWRLFDGKRCAQATFAGPHAYISANWFPKPEKAVPTWNYTLARVTGRPTVLEDSQKIDWFMEALSRQYEGEDGWAPAQAEPGFMTAMRRGIVAFSMPVESWEAKTKLSQNKSAADVSALAEKLEGAGEGAVANAMRRGLIQSSKG